MEHFFIEITETLQKTVEVDAESYQDAVDKVDEMYKRKEVVLEHTNMIDYEIEEPVGYALGRQAVNR